MSKITDYTAIPSVAPNDLLIAVDVSDTSMAATGTDKKVSVSQLPFVNSITSPDGSITVGGTGAIPTLIVPGVLTKAGNLFGLASNKTARTNIGTYQIINVRDYGAIPDSTTDNLPFINAAIDDCAIIAGTYLHGGTELSPRLVLYFPAGSGTYGIKNSPLILPNYVSVKGDGYWSTVIQQLTAGQDTIQVNPGGYQGLGAGTRVDTTCVTTNLINIVSDAAATSLDIGHTVTGAGIPAGTYITAVGGGNITLSQNATASGTVSLTISLFDDSKIGVTMRDLSVYGAGQGSGGGIGSAFKAYNTPHMRFDACRFAYCGGHAFQANYSWDAAFDECIFGNAGGNGVELLNQCNVFNFDNCSFVSNSGHGLHLKTGVTCTVNDGDVESNGQHGIYLETSFTARVRGTDFENNNVSNGGYTNLYVGSSGSNAGPSVESNNFSGNGTVVNNIVVDTALNVIIKGNEFTSATRSGSDILINSGAVGTQLQGNTTANAVLVTDSGVGTCHIGKRLVGGAVAIADASTIAVDASLGNVFRVTLGGNRTLGNPSNATVNGQEMLVEVTQPASGGPWTLAYGTNYAFSTDLPSPVLSTAANAADYLKFIYNASVGKWRLIGIVQGF